mmetsp:Transcript_2165/g.5127  ORF Transcript_2165/g.5127 Transcript_2165/m.5127 type:complete len:513 (-) Transcript_2165:43-1581(-)
MVQLDTELNKAKGKDYRERLQKRVDALSSSTAPNTKPSVVEGCFDEKLPISKQVKVIATSKRNKCSSKYEGKVVDYHKDSVFYNRLELYRGSVSVVYRATCATTRQQVIVKAYKTHRMNEKQLHKANREIHIMKAVRGDPGVVRYMGHFEDKFMTFIVMEFCERGDLFKSVYLNGGSLSEEKAVTKVIRPLLQVLSRLHAGRIAHRDIKPENIFLTGSGRLKLGDFGLALSTERELPFTRSGTLDYMAPEVLANPATDLSEGPCITLQDLTARGVQPYDEKVDIWAVGILAYELVVGKPPFEMEDEQYTMKLIMNSNRIAFPPAMSKEWADFIRATLSKSPELRPSAELLLAHPWLRRFPPRDDAPGASPPPPAPRSIDAAELAAQISQAALSEWQGKAARAPPQTPAKASRAPRSAESPEIPAPRKPPASAAASAHPMRPPALWRSQPGVLQPVAQSSAQQDGAAISGLQQRPRSAAAAAANNEEGAPRSSGIRSRIRQYFWKQRLPEPRT